MHLVKWFRKSSLFTLQPIQGSNDDRHISFIWFKLRSKYSIHLLSPWRFGVSIHDVMILDAHAVQLHHHQINPHGLMGNNTCVRNCWWYVSHVTSRKHPRLASHILHFHIENHMKLYELIPWWWSVLSTSDIKSDLNRTLFP